MWRSIGHCWVQAAELSMVMLAAPEKQALKLAAAAEMNVHLQSYGAGHPLYLRFISNECVMAGFILSLHMYLNGADGVVCYALIGCLMVMVHLCEACMTCSAVQTVTCSCGHNARFWNASKLPACRWEHVPLSLAATMAASAVCGAACRHCGRAASCVGVAGPACRHCGC